MIAKPEEPRVRTVERWEYFNDTTGAMGYMTATGPVGGHSHPDRCKCQGSDPTPHKHYDEEPHECARCGCRGYRAARKEPKSRLVGMAIRLLGQDMVLVDGWAS